MKIQRFFERMTSVIVSLIGSLVIITGLAAVSMAATFTVSSFSDSGAGSLRQAILDANANANSGSTPDVIAVQNGTGTINLLSPLPAITDAVRIINFDNPSGRVELNGLATRGQAQLSIGLDFEAANCATASPACEVWGFALNRFGEAGIRVGPHSDGVIITQNYIGTDILGVGTDCPDAAHPCGNLNAGILVAGAANVVIGTDSAQLDAGGGGHSNTIGGNFGRGIVVGNGYVGGVLVAGSAVIHNNYIGINNANPTPGAPIGNTADGILLAATSGSQIGGTALLDRNYIGSNGYNGIEIIPDVGAVNTPASNNIIVGNFIGQTGGSVSARGNSGSGIVIRGNGNTVGGTNAAARNVIVANAVAGIAVSGSTATGNIIGGNNIGVGSDNSTALGNTVAGVQMSDYAAGNTIGGSGVTPGTCNGACNLIANNGGTTAMSARAGIYVDQTAGTGNTIRENSVFANGSGTGIGIDAGAPGKYTNDAGDADTIQNKPVLTTANTSKFISGTLSSVPSSTFTIDFYLNQSTDVGNLSQGRTWIGSTQTTTDGSGNAAFNYTTTVALPLGSNVTATATRGALPSVMAAPAVGSTSEFSDPVTIVNAPTAATVRISGRVTDGSGAPIGNAIVTLTGQDGHTISVRSNSFGYFDLAAVPAGASYLVGTSRKGFAFDAFLLQVRDSISDVSITPRQ